MTTSDRNYVFTQQQLTDNFRQLRKIALTNGITTRHFKSLCKCTEKSSDGRTKLHLPSVVLLAAAVLIGLSYSSFDKIRSAKCALENNFFVMEMTRPVTNCTICNGVQNVPILVNMTIELFALHAYESRPFLVRDATRNWSAITTFNFDFFKNLYQDIPSALESVEDECQFFPFRTEFLSLGEVFAMSRKRAELGDGESPWYIGWSNCHPEIAAALRKHYRRPHFLPEDSECSAIDWIFMGGAGQGASLHLDYVHRPSWQAQISGRKTWHLVPPPECENVCHEMDITVNPGDIFFLDTNQWYHNTRIHPGELSITIGSEYD